MGCWRICDGSESREIVSGLDCALAIESEGKRAKRAEKLTQSGQLAGDGSGFVLKLVSRDGVVGLS